MIMANYSIKNFNGWNEVEGKVFLGDELNTTGAQVSIQKLAAGTDAPIITNRSNYFKPPTGK